MTHLGSQSTSDEITEFYLQQSRKEGGGSYATAYDSGVGGRGGYQGGQI